MATVVEVVRQIIAEQAAVDMGAVLVTTSLKSLALDSLDAVEITIQLENFYKIDIPSDQIGKFEKVSDVVLYVDSKVKEKQ